jgi:hypothetical protein
VALHLLSGAGRAFSTWKHSSSCDESEAMLIYSMSVSVDGFIADRDPERVR